MFMYNINSKTFVKPLFYKFFEEKYLYFHNKLKVGNVKKKRCYCQIGV